MILFKWVIAVIGFFVLGPLGAFIGFFIGGAIDRSRSLGVGAVNPFSAQQRQAVFLKTTFSLMGHLAKADGRVSEEEIQQAEMFMQQMGMTPEHRREAIGFFKKGSSEGFDVNAQLNEFNAACGHTRNLKQALLTCLIAMALADAVIVKQEQALLQHIAQKLGVSQQAFEQLVQMIKAQMHVAGGENSASVLDEAYQALGVTQEVSDKELKRAYRRLMSENHPDKLIGQGMPKDMVAEATKRSQDIQKAYQLIKKSRA